MSLGGEETWYIAEQYPDHFAAIIPVCGRTSQISSIRKNVNKLADMPIWMFHGAKDNVYAVEESDKMYQLLKNINPNIKYTRYPDLGHGQTHDTAYKNKELYDWLLTYKKK